MNVVATHAHYAAHIAPVAALIPDVDVTIVASYTDLRRARRASRIVLMQHGAGQSYSDAHPCYAGGRDNDAVGLFLTPNEHSAGRWQRAYPAARVEVVGCPRLDDLPRREPGPLTVAVSTHWNGGHVPEVRSAWPYMMPGVRALTERYTIIGHGHPKRHDLERKYKRMGVEWVPDFREVCRRADVYVCDNSSTLFEFASTGCPVVVFDSPQYRPDARHGLRFWDAADVGVRVSSADALPDAVAEALEDAPERRAAREAALDIVYAYRTGAAQRAADAITDWAA